MDGTTNMETCVLNSAEDVETFLLLECVLIIYWSKIQNIVTWTTMIEGFGSHGLGLEALELFGIMLEERIIPNCITFLSLLSACGHSGLVIEGCEVYNSMKWIFGLQPDLDHYTCIVDLFGQ